MTQEEIDNINTKEEAEAWVKSLCEIYKDKGCQEKECKDCILYNFDTLMNFIEKLDEYNKGYNINQ